MIRKVPGLAWLLTALTCFLVGALVGTGWGHAAPPPVARPGGGVVTVEVAVRATETPAPTPPPTRMPTSAPTPDPMEPTLSPRPGGTGSVR